MPASSRCMERSRSLTVYLSLLTLVVNTLCAIALQFLPTNTSPLAFNFSLYSTCGAVISLLGFIGVIKGYPSLLSIFSNHLILDALISTLPRLFLLPIVASLPTTFCSFFDPRHPVLEQQDSTDHGPWMLHRCRALTWFALAIGGVIMVCLTVVQWVCAWRVRAYVRYLEGRQQSSSLCLEKENFDVANDNDIEKV